jgi:ribosomal protein S18 acetylase RimI-like enzyme
LHPINLRPAVLTDLDFAFEVTEAAMRGYVEQTWGTWEPMAQRENHEKSFKPETHQLILLAGVPAGVLATETHEDHVQLEKLYLLPRFRNAGVGSQVLESLLRSAASTGKAVRLRVLAANTSAQRLYARHGFRVTSTTPERVFMQAGA